MIKFDGSGGEVRGLNKVEMAISVSRIQVEKKVNETGSGSFGWSKRGVSC